MKDTTVASRYAHALFLVTEKRKETPNALEDLKGVWQILRPMTAVGRLLASPLVLLSDKRKVVSEAFKGKLVPSVAVFIDLLLRKKRLTELESIVVQFEALVEKLQGIKRAQVVSAVPLTAAEVAKLHAELERFTHAKIKLTATVEPELLGGALVRIGDRVVDRTVRTMLESITEHLVDVSV
jgi:F-type H+-transporting ATPase subunit delta